MTFGQHIEVRGLSDIFNLLDRLEIIADLIAPATLKVLYLLRDRMRRYPPPLAGQIYKRTFRLKNSWEAVPIHQGRILGKVVSKRPDYNLWVQDPTYQVGIHRGRWWTTETVKEMSEDEVEQIYLDFVVEELGLTL